MINVLRMIQSPAKVLKEVRNVKEKLYKCKAFELDHKD